MQHLLHFLQQISKHKPSIIDEKETALNQKSCFRIEKI